MTTPASPRRARRGFTLLEVMIALAILVTGLAVLMETQSTAVMMTMEADRIVVATQLAQEKLSEVTFLVEHEGFTDDEINEEGDFDDFGDEALNLEMKALEDYHWEYLIMPVDLEQASDLNAMVQGAAGKLGFGGEAAGIPDLSSMGLPIGPDAIAESLDPFVREVRVRVWWGEDLKEAEELGNEVILTTHVINPQGNILGRAGLGGGGSAGGAGGAGGRGQGQGARSPGPGRQFRGPAALQRLQGGARPAGGGNR